MKTIGIIGGISWVSTIDYYRFINQQINERLGGTQAGKIILYSLNFGEIKALTDQGDWDSITDIACTAAQHLQQSGADCLLIGANTMHKIAGPIQEAVQIPVIHVAEVTAKAINKKQLRKVALLGTKYTMELDFYPTMLSKHGIETMIPDAADRSFINSSIYNELGKGILSPDTKARYQEIIGKLMEQGAEGVILGCTEIPMLIKQADSPIPVFDTTFIHASAAVDFALNAERLMQNA